MASKEDLREALVAYATRRAEEEGLPPEALVGLMKQESNFNPQAVGDGGKAVGVLQFWPETAKEVGIQDRTDPYQSIEGAIRFLKKRGAHESTENLSRALDQFRGNKSGPPIMPSVIESGREVLGGRASDRDRALDQALRAAWTDETQAMDSALRVAFGEVDGEEIPDPFQGEDPYPHREYVDVVSDITKQEQIEEHARLADKIANESIGLVRGNALLLLENLSDYPNLLVKLANAGTELYNKVFGTDIPPMPELSSLSDEDREELKKRLGFFGRLPAYAIETAIMYILPIAWLKASAAKKIAAGQALGRLETAAHLYPKLSTGSVIPVITGTLSSSAIGDYRFEAAARSFGTMVADTLTDDPKWKAITAGFTAGALGMLAGILGDWSAEKVIRFGLRFSPKSIKEALVTPHETAEVAEGMQEFLRKNLPETKLPPDFPKDALPAGHPDVAQLTKLTVKPQTIPHEVAEAPQDLQEKIMRDLRKSIGAPQESTSLATRQALRESLPKAADPVDALAQNVTEYMGNLAATLRDDKTPNDLVKSIAKHMNDFYSGVEKLEDSAWKKLTDSDITIDVSDTVDLYKQLKENQGLSLSMLPSVYAKELQGKTKEVAEEVPALILPAKYLAELSRKPAQTGAKALKISDYITLRSGLLRIARTSSDGNLRHIAGELADSLTRDAQKMPFGLNKDFDNARAVTAYKYSMLNDPYIKGAMRAIQEGNLPKAGAILAGYANKNPASLHGLIEKALGTAEIPDPRLKAAIKNAVQEMGDTQKIVFKNMMHDIIGYHLARKTISADGKPNESFVAGAKIFLEQRRDTLKLVDKGEEIISAYQKQIDAAEEFLKKYRQTLEKSEEATKFFGSIYQKSTPSTIFEVMVDATIGPGGTTQEKINLFNLALKKHGISPRQAIIDDLVERSEPWKLLEHPEYKKLLASNFSKAEIDRIEHLVMFAEQMAAKSPIEYADLSPLGIGKLGFLERITASNLGGLMGRPAGASLATSYYFTRLIQGYKSRVHLEAAGKLLQKIITDQNEYELFTELLKPSPNIASITFRLAKIGPQILRLYSTVEKEVKKEELENRQRSLREEIERRRQQYPAANMSLGGAGF